jgi:hypothetical protein
MRMEDLVTKQDGFGYLEGLRVKNVDIRKTEFKVRSAWECEDVRMEG